MKPGIFLSISIVLLTLWIAGFLAFGVASVLLHLLLLLGVLFLAGHLVENTTTT